ncbi:MAG: hypothetical protein E6K64_08785 [Nitrospirae bacterium]|nr:MAG: hypothetical protein E6K64_08785 [Nitrospirota bacterium]
MSQHVRRRRRLRVRPDFPSPRVHVGRAWSKPGGKLTGLIVVKPPILELEVGAREAARHQHHEHGTDYSYHHG